MPLSPLEIRHKFDTEYLGDDGLVRGWPKSNGTFPGSIDNDNGVLFLAYAYAMMNELGLIFDGDREAVDKAIGAIQLQGWPGLYQRSQRDKRLNSKDNILGIVYLSRLFKLRYHFDVVRYGQEHYWNFDNVTPGSWKNIEAQSQGGDVALYLTANDLPTGKTLKLIPNMMWLATGLVSSGFDGDRGHKNLSWLRLKILDDCNDHNPYVGGDAKAYKWGKQGFNLGRSIRGMPHIRDSVKYFQNKDHVFYDMAEMMYSLGKV